ncbi:MULTISPECIES: hypothetical protein [Bifidobacterium]|uniref:hypothetical protein n=1 Tax=Bifidobacterium TaxID=1678 RepID=UPI00126A729F|nr:hypothetical protein [Bifidobacterium tibiigranuli]MCI1210556.1 hypothetical protein [Bifidobacterium tibiigranuli]MCI1220931.1 hypothetical protein [Bifidobacterium tibiigranuli]MCI1232172.1 hypothetical protein [Bifidobacterium tibiigranuli]MCI1254136.1 hypothetical protein [Bifidobacterium tibiigranuli]
MNILIGSAKSGQARYRLTARSRFWHQALWWGGLTALLAAAMIGYGIGWRSIPPLLIGTAIVPPSLWEYALLAVSLGCWLAAGVLRLADAGRIRPAAIITTIAGLICMFPLLGFTWLTADYGYRILPPESTGGCRVVAASAPMLSGTAGDVFIADPGSIVLQRVRTSWWSYWWSNDNSENGYNPINAGDWSLRWNGDQGRLQIRFGPTTMLTCPHQ